MSEETTLWIGGGDGETRYLVADLGLFHQIICFGPSTALLEHIKDEISERMTCPLKIIPIEELKGVKMEVSGIPAGFTIVQNGMQNVPDIQFA